MPPLLKTILFRTHWILGISAGLVLAVVGATGAILGFELEILGALNPHWKLDALGERLPPDALVARVRAAYPDFDVRGLVVPLDDAAPIEVRLARGAERGGIVVGVDPWRDEVLGEPRGHGFVETSEQLHRYLAGGETGKQLVGASTVGLLLMAITGLVLRWPRRAGSPKAWLTFDTRLKGRGFLWHLHAVLATWVLVFYLACGLTGLWWSYAFYRNAVNAMAGLPPQPPRPPPSATPGPRVDPPSLDAAFRTLREQAPDATRAMANFPPVPGATTVDWRYLGADATHDRAFSTLKVEAATGAVQSHEHWAELPRGRRFVGALFPLHSGSFFGTPGRMLTALASLLMPFFAVTGVWLWMLRRAIARRSRANASLAIGSSGPLHASDANP